jgi:hypothetical protein
MIRIRNHKAAVLSTLTLTAVVALTGCGKESITGPSVPPPTPSEPSGPPVTPPPPQPPATTIVEVPGGWVGNLCTQHTRGDREFSGNGPRVRVGAREELRGREVWLVVRFEAVETESDWTTGVQDYASRLYTIPDGWHFKEWKSDRYSFAEYVDTDHSTDVVSIQDAGLMWRLWVVGDTDGNDVGNCTTDDTRIVRLDYNPVLIKLEQD